MSRPRRTRHSADDGSFGRSAGMAAGRGAVLLAVAVLLGIVLLNAADDPPPERVATEETEDTTPAESSDTSIPVTTATSAPPRGPAEVKVLTANGTGVKGVARKVTDQLKGAGFNVLAPTDASKADATAVYFTAGFDREAQAIAQVLGVPTTSAQPLPTPAPVPDARGANVVVVVGPELAQRLSTTATTATTAAGARASSSTTAATTATTRP